MAVDGYPNPVLYDGGGGDDDDDDDGPISFKRVSSSSKSKAVPQMPDSSSGRVSSVNNSKGQTSHLQQNGSTPSKASTEKTKSANSSARATVSGQANQWTERKPKSNMMDKSLSKKPYVDNDSDDEDKPISSRTGPNRRLQKTEEGKELDDSDDDKPIGARRIMENNKVRRFNAKGKEADDSGKPDNANGNKPLSSKISSSSVRNVGEKKVLGKHIVKIKSEDSDDHNPLSSRFPSNTAEKVGNAPPLGKAKAANNNNSEDSEDDKPLSSRFAARPTVNNNNSDDSEDEKPLATRFASKNTGNTSTNATPKEERSSLKSQTSSSTKEPTSISKSVKSLNKRPLDDCTNHTNSSAKKAKLSEASTSGKVTREATVKRELNEDDSDYMPLSQRIKKSDSSSSKPSPKNVVKKSTPFKKYSKKIKMKKAMKNSEFSKTLKVPPGSGEGQKWTTLEHNGVIFPPPYKPHGVKMLYNGQPIELTPEQEEVATMFAVMKDTDYATKPTFIENFFGDWKRILGKNHVIKNFELCDFTPIYEWHLEEKEKKKQMTTEEKKALKEEKLKQEEKYMWAIVDGVKEKVGNFRVEPPGLFRGRGEHPKMGKFKRRIRPSDITINIGKGTPIPECPIPGERWKEVKHDNTVTWLAFWNDPINQRDFKYVFLAASSTLKGQSDREKYEKARKLKDYIHTIRVNYTKDFISKDPTKRQIAVATYLIDKLALRAGNEKDDDEADTVGCCTLKVENVVCVPPNKLQFDFLGKDSIRYFNTVEVELPVYKAIEQFRTGKKADGKRKGDGDDIFDLLDTSKLNVHLKELMPGLTAKVFRTYNASITLDDILNEETKDDTVQEKIAIYQRANKEVAIICNHQRTVSKSHESQMSRLNEKIDDLKTQREELRIDLSRAKKGKPPLKDKDGKAKRNLAPEAIEKKLNQIKSKIEKMEMDKTIKEDLKTVALGTSKINYLDPRISVAWCKRHEVPIEKIFNKSLLAKFAWSMDVDPSFRF